MLRHPRVKRPDLFQAEESGERLGGHAAALSVDDARRPDDCGRRRSLNFFRNLTALSGRVENDRQHHIALAPPAMVAISTRLLPDAS
jgi:hypothetical protein